ncbi:hypothetical protein POM88_021738 [Heracleum sosnowskyi]|uniref:Uncharacterized protein n=1 Tax=Heracleum sosnowskyi TaxID=360622 RepID=A0AAD8MU34_9APIA|nr:hypothetical protein POM88_021738 [Heracleum sosnowskyi]
MKNQDCCNTGQRNSSCSILSDDASLLTKNMCIVNANCLSEMAEIINSLSGPSLKSNMDKQALVAYLFSFHLLRAIEDTKAIGSLTSKSRLHVDCGANPLATDTGAHNESHHNPIEIHVLEGFTRQEHVFARAFASIFVSLCLHPVDTIKTITHSCRSDPNSIPDISRSIISSRGVTGLYRIIASNIAASALITDVYTFTSESVKGVLLPYFSKGCHSLAHCTVGGSASISATSVIFTPSERIKQPIQVSSHYRSSWNALLGIVGKGGFSSLYVGWGVVLCKNVTHSVIKFYTYERLKQLMSSSLQSNGQREMLQILICGGLAGSTAAIFTTLFDVVKTRLHTLISGSRNKYGENSTMLMKLVYNLDRASSCEHPSDSGLCIELFAFHMALIEKSQYFLVVLSLASLLYYGSWKEAIHHARSQTEVPEPKLMEATPFISDRIISERVIQLANLIQEFVHVMTDANSLHEMMETFSGCTCSGLVFVPKGLRSYIANAFGGIDRLMKGNMQGHTSFDIDYDMLKKCNVKDSRFVIGKLLWKLSAACHCFDDDEDDEDEENGEDHVDSDDDEAAADGDEAAT